MNLTKSEEIRAKLTMLLEMRKKHIDQMVAEAIEEGGEPTLAQTVSIMQRDIGTLTMIVCEMLNRQCELDRFVTEFQEASEQIGSLP